MADLDARVAALMRLINEYTGHRIGVETMPGHVELDAFERAQDKAHAVETELEQAIRAELQKPALHEPVTLPQRISELVDTHESLRAAARVLEIDPGYLSRLASGEKCEPGTTLLRRLGLRQITTYERV